MKCISCEFEVDPKWNYAVETNKCPRCGSDIMEADLKELLSNLDITMELLGKYPEQTKDWLLSKFNLINIGSEDLVKFIPKEYLDTVRSEAVEAELQKINQTKASGIISPDKKTVKVVLDDQESEVLIDKIQSDDKTTEFFKRAEAVKPRLDNFHSVAEKTSHIKKMVEKIKKTGSLEDELPSEIQSELSEDYMENMNAYMNQEPEIRSSISDPEVDDNIPSVVLAVANKYSGKNNQQHADIMKLKQMREKVSSSRSNFSSGGGSFSRG